MEAATAIPGTKVEHIAISTLLFLSLFPYTEKVSSWDVLVSICNGKYFGQTSLTIPHTAKSDSLFSSPE